jgi:D-alanyl-lipoteichoic acid acyltransferase DltB (MBOAT superfamily)
MFFDTPVYAVFLTLVVLAYWRLEWRSQNRMLLAASYIFYGWWDVRFLGLIAASTIVDYYCARAIAASEDTTRRRALLTTSLVVNLGFLATFKYFNFFVDSFAAVLESLGFHQVPVTTLRILLPPGISFYTFQEVAYIVDVYKRKLEPATSLVEYALFISLFPHLIAGPIQRPNHLLPQVQAPRRFDQERFFDGLMLILSGLFRKAVIADNCALVADAVFSGRLGPPNLATTMLGTYAFAWQIYGDFSGYSDIARGSAQLLGFHFMVNFRQPYLATTLQDFWRRWHISLSTWLRDYLYIPLGGNRHGEAMTYRNLMLTMLLGGLWHGANWTFVVWGGIHGVGLAIERVFTRTLRTVRTAPALSAVTGLAGVGRPGAPLADAVRPDGRAAQPNSPSLLAVRPWIARVALFHLVCLAWIFFRAESLHAAFAMLGGLTTLTWAPEYTIALKFLALFTIPLFVVDVITEARNEEYVFETVPETRRVAVGVALMAIVAVFAANQLNAFIYFRF